MEMDKVKLVKYIDHTQLKPFATFDDIKKLCDEAIKYGFYLVMVAPIYVKFVKEYLADKGKDIKVGTVVGFPLGYSHTSIKVKETLKAIEDGADEIDMVMNISYFKSKKYNLVLEDIKEVVNASQGKIVKVIVETCYLTVEEKYNVAKLVLESGAHFIKTSTGFGKEGAKIEDVKIFKQVVGDKIGIKAAGGIRTLKQMLDFIKAGANRIGTSSSVKIIEEIE